MFRGELIVSVCGVGLDKLGSAIYGIAVPVLLDQVMFVCSGAGTVAIRGSIREQENVTRGLKVDSTPICL